MKLSAVPVSLRDACAFVGQFHRHNKPPQGGKFAIGCTAGDGLIGVCIVGRPVARLLDDGWTAEVVRVCVSPAAQRGANSFLYACAWRAWRAMGGRKLITYTLKTEGGASLRGAGWKVVAETRPVTWDRQAIGRARDYEPIYGQRKFRWEVSN